MIKYFIQYEEFGVGYSRQPLSLRMIIYTFTKYSKQYFPGNLLVRYISSAALQKVQYLTKNAYFKLSNLHFCFCPR